MNEDDKRVSGLGYILIFIVYLLSTIMFFVVDTFVGDIGYFEAVGYTVSALFASNIIVGLVGSLLKAFVK